MACGALRDPVLLPRYQSLLAPKEMAMVVPSGPVAVAAAWGVARLEGSSTWPLLRQLAVQGTPEVRTLAILGLGFGKDRQSIGLLGETLRSPDAGNLGQAAAAFALAEMGVNNHVPTLLKMARARDALPREAALIALARLAPDQAPSLVVDTLFDANASTRKAALSAALVMGTGEDRRNTEPWEVPDGQIQVRVILEKLQPSGYGPADYSKTMVAIEPLITAAAVNAARSSATGARLVADALMSRVNALGFAPFTDNIEEIRPDLRMDVESAVGRLVAEVESAFVALIRHPSSDLRIRAVRTLAHCHTAQAEAAVVSALHDEDEAVQRAALAGLGKTGSQRGVEALSKTLSESTVWSLRLKAARALGLVEPGTAPVVAVKALSTAARKDSFALVREAALKSMARVARTEAVSVLEDASANDDEPAVREVATRLLRGG